MSFILDALRKSEHERQRSTVPGLAQVPLAVPQPQIPRWAFAVIGVLAAAVLALGAAWWRTARLPAEPAASAPTIERSVELPPPARTASSALVRAAPAPSAAPEPLAAAAEHSPAAVEPSPEPSLERAAASSVAASDAAEHAPAVEGATAATFSSRLDLPADGPALPSATALAAEGVTLPPLRLELHAFSAQPADRFVFINGRKYVEGERLAEGPQLLSIEPTGAVLAHAGRRFLLVQE